MAKKLTTYRNPSILTRIETADNVQTLAALRQAIGFGIVSGRIDADRRTVEKWDEALFARIVALLRASKTGREATLVFNTVFTWFNHARREALRAICTEVTLPMPSEAEAWGVTA